MRNIFLIFFGLALACGDDDSVMDASTAMDGSSPDAAVSDASAADATTQGDTGVNVDPPILWRKFVSVLEASCACLASPDLSDYCSVSQVTEQQIACLADAATGSEVQPNFQCMDRRLNDLEACIMSATCGGSDSTDCMQRFENRVESCPMLTEATEDALAACGDS